MDEQDCLDGSVNGFGRRLGEYFALDAETPEDMLTILGALDGSSGDGTATIGSVD